jgi:hypothetical protein
MAVANLFRRRLASVATTTSLAAVFAVVIALLANQEAQRVEILASATALAPPVAVQLGDDAPPDAVDRLARTLPGVAEPVLVFHGVLQVPGTEGVTRRVLAAPSGPWLAGLRLGSGRRPASDDAREALVDGLVAATQGLRVGDDVVCYRGPNEPEGETLKVVGILQGVAMGLAVIPLGVGRSLVGDPVAASAVYLAPGAGTPVVDPTALGREMPGVEAVVTRAQATDEISRSLSGTQRSSRLGAAFAVAIALVTLSLLAGLDAEERSGEMALLAALGWRDRTLLGTWALEVLVRGSLALAAALLLAPALSRFLLDRIEAASSNHVEVAMSPSTMGALALPLVLLLPLASVPAWWRSRRAPAGRALRLLAPE